MERPQIEKLARKIKFFRYRDHSLQLGSLALNFVFILVVASLVPIDSFGKFTFEFTISSILAVFCKFGVDSLLMYLYPKVGFNQSVNNAAPILISAIVFISLISLGAGLLSLTVVLLAILIATDEVLLALHRAKDDAVLFLLCRNLLLIFRIAGVCVFPSVDPLILCAIFQLPSVLYFLMINLREFIHDDHQENAIPQKTVNMSMVGTLVFSVKNTVSSLIGVIAVKIDILMLTIMIGYEQVGRYEVGARWGFLAFIPITIFSAINAPKVSKLSKRKTLHFFQIYYRDTRRKVFLLTAGYTTFLIVAQQALWLIESPFDPSLLTVGVVLAVGHTASSFFGPSGTALVMMGYPGAHLLRVSSALSVNILLNFYLIPRYGALGAAYSSAIVTAFAAIISYSVLRHIVANHEAVLK